MANVSITQVESLRLSSFSATHFTQVHTFSLSLYHVPGPDHRGYQLPHWLLAQKPLPSPSLVFLASSVVEGHRYLCLPCTLDHFGENYRALKQGY